MDKKKYLGAVGVVVIVLLLAGCGETPRLEVEPDLPPMEIKTFPDTAPATEGLTILPGDIVVPKDLAKCPADIFAKDCAAEPDAKTCAYLYKIQGTEARVDNMQYKNTCYACRFFTEAGGMNLGGAMTYRLIGLADGVCTQGSYKLK